MASSYLERYRAGEREAVWDELLSLGAEVRKEPLRGDAEAVVRETMLRVRQNLERIVERLRDLGYRFTTPARALTPPDPEVLAILDRLEQEAGPVPMSIRGFYEVVGSVDLMGTHPKLSARAQQPDLAGLMQSALGALTRNLGVVPPAAPPPFPGAGPAARLLAGLDPAVRQQLQQAGWVSRVLMEQALGVSEKTRRWAETGGPLPDDLRRTHELAEDLARSMSPSTDPGHAPAQSGPASDPLVVWPPHDDDLDGYRYFDRNGEEEEEAPGSYALDIAPDACHKAGESGGGPYQIIFPDPAVDAVVVGLEEHGTFVRYLRECFRWGGFPGLRELRTPPADELEKLTRDLLPI